MTGVLFAPPTTRGPDAAPLMALGLLVLDLGLLVLIATWFLRSSVERPLRRLASEVRRIAEGDDRHRIGAPLCSELQGLQESVNLLADRLMADRRRLAENVESLDRTNQELRMARDQVVHAARMASVGTLAAGIAHEVGNPLGAVIGFVDVARARAKRGKEEGADVELLDSIRAEAGRIDRIVRGLLDYARPPRGSADPLPAADVIGRVRDLLERQGALDHLEAEWVIASGGERLLDDPYRVEQVLVNLVLNAEHAVRGVDRPSIRVELREEEGELRALPRRRVGDPPGIDYMHRRRVARDAEAPASAEATERVTVIEVMDSGHGIPEDRLEQIFDPFFTTKDPGEGTGLGLSICARLVEGMGGVIEAENRPGSGARFVIRLPVLYHAADTAHTETQ